MKVISYDDRVSKIKSEEDINIQLNLAKSYTKRLRTKARKAGILEEKIQLNECVKKADITLRKLRLNAFDLEDIFIVKK